MSVFEHSPTKKCDEVIENVYIKGIVFSEAFRLFLRCFGTIYLTDDHLYVQILAVWTIAVQTLAAWTLSGH